MRAAALAALLAGPAAGQGMEPMAPEAFLDFAEGRTLTFASTEGASFGTEQFLPDGTTRYVLADGTCLLGVVEPRGAAVCFTYKATGRTHCWWMFSEDGRILSRSTAVGDGTVVEVVDVSDAPVICDGEPIA